MRSEGMNATVSSIHINGWFGAHNKLGGRALDRAQLLGRELDAELDRWVYVGDSTNDQLMFEHFPHSVGVANIARFVPQLSHLPRYVTRCAPGSTACAHPWASMARRAEFLLPAGQGCS
jgi:hydroxymethylpyrimidine pyrophosphatase-like HAD family hydrolase